MRLQPDHPTAVAFLDETGAIASDRFFAVGLLTLPEPAALTRRLQKLRDRLHWYDEFHWYELTSASLPVYRDALSIVAAIEDARFACLIADRRQFDPVQCFGNAWTGYERMASQLIVGNIRRHELVSPYGSPADRFEPHTANNDRPALSGPGRDQRGPRASGTGRGLTPRAGDAAPSTGGCDAAL
jgi:hypothetical protein